MYVFYFRHRAKAQRGAHAYITYWRKCRGKRSIYLFLMSSGLSCCFRDRWRFSFTAFELINRFQFISRNRTELRRFVELEEAYFFRILLFRWFRFECMQLLLLLTHQMDIFKMNYKRSAYLWQILPSSTGGGQFYGPLTIYHDMANRQLWPPEVHVKDTAWHSEWRSLFDLKKSNKNKIVRTNHWEHK